MQIETVLLLPKIQKLMLYLAPAILCSVMLGFFFKLFPKYKVDTFQAIVFNYFTCVAVGWVHLGHFPIGLDFGQTASTHYAMFLGIVFISGFNLAALTVQYFSVTVSQVMQKMSILLTVPFAILVYQESAGLAKLLGVLMALGAIVLINLPAKEPDLKGLPEGEGAGKRALWIPILTWLLAGVIEITFIWVKEERIVPGASPDFVISIFFTAGLLGMGYAVTEWWRRRRLFTWRNVLAGVLMGVPNYGSIYFLVMALNSGMEGSKVFPLMNIGVILLTTIGALALFHEKLNRYNWVGLALALVAIVFISF